MKQRKKAVSPVISTVLLIMIVVILALIIFLWARGFIKEAVLKEIAGVEKVADYYCGDISVESIVNNDGSFGFRNIGTVPIYKFNLKLTELDTGSSEVIEIDSDSGGMVNPGFLFLTETGDYKTYDKYDEVKIIPVLLGKGKKQGGVVEFSCSERQGIII